MVGVIADESSLEKTGLPYQLDEWHHVAMTYDPGRTKWFFTSMATR
jgi:hypothetical protein